METKEKFIKVNGMFYSETDINRMSPIQITELLNSIPLEIEQCKNSLLPGKNPKNEKINFKIKQLQLGMNWIAVIRKKKNIEQSVSEDRLFKMFAKEYLKKSDFEKILKMAKEASV